MIKTTSKTSLLLQTFALTSVDKAIQKSNAGKQDRPHTTAAERMTQQIQYLPITYAIYLDMYIVLHTQQGYACTKL